MTTINVIFSGGPMNNQKMAVEDLPEVRFPIIPNADWMSENYFYPLQDVRIMRYHRTEYFEEECRVFEFLGMG